MKRIGITRRTVKTIAVFGLAALAAGVVYGEDPYIESKGTADYGGISTGYRMKGSSRVEVDFALLDGRRRIRAFTDDLHEIVVQQFKRSRVFHIASPDRIFH